MGGTDVTREPESELVVLVVLELVESVVLSVLAPMAYPVNKILPNIDKIPRRQVGIRSGIKAIFNILARFFLNILRINV